MRILFLSKRVSTGKDLLVDRCGRLHELSAALVDLGHEVTGACFSYHKGLPAPTGSGGKVNWNSYGSDDGLISGLLHYWNDLNSLIKRHQPEIIIGASDSLHVIIAAQLGKRYELPYIVDLYDNYESFGLTRLPFMKFGFRRAVKQASAISVVSDELGNYVRENYRPQSEISVIENAVPGDVFFPMDKREARNSLKLPENAVLIGTIGALDGSRGIDILYQAFLYLAEKYDDLHLALAGRVDKQSPLPQHERIHFLGELDYERVPVFLNSLDIGIICNLPDAFGSYCFPQKLYEMIACKIPIIATNVGVMKRVFSDIPGNRFEPGDVKGLAVAIISQMHSPVLPDLKVPSWIEKAHKLDEMIRQAVTL